MDTIRAIHARRTVHAWHAQPLEPGVLDTILDAGHQAPCHKKTWPWRFLVVGAATRERLVPLGVELAARKAGIAVSPKVEAKVRGKVVNPGALVVVALKRCDNAFQAREDYAAASCAVQNMLLAATAAGLGSKWGTGGLTRHDTTHEILGVDASQEEIIGFLFFGVPQRVPTVERPPLEAHVTRLP
jgi:nitroreductase